MANQDGEKYHVEKLDRKINEYTNKRKKKKQKKLENNYDKVTHRIGLIAWKHGARFLDRCNKAKSVQSRFYFKLQLKIIPIHRKKMLVSYLEFFCNPVNDFTKDRYRRQKTSQVIVVKWFR